MKTFSKNIYVPPKCTVYELEIEGVICGSLDDEATHSLPVMISYRQVHMAEELLYGISDYKK